MAKKFKAYQQHTTFLLPPNLDELIDEKELVRVVDRVIEQINMDLLESTFHGGGCPSFHPRMMLKVLVYAYCGKIYSCRAIAKALKRDVSFMWLSGMQTPDFNTVNRFRSVYLKEVLEKVFTQTVELLLQEGYLRGEDYFVDGTKLEADASKYSYVWKKNVQRHREKIQQRARDILQEVEQINRDEDKHYQGQDLPEYGQASTLTSQTIQQTVAAIHQSMDKRPPEQHKTVAKKLRELEQASDKLTRYEAQQRTLGTRNSYSKTDPDATFLRLNNGELRAAYNLQAATENGFVAGYSVSQTAHDANSLIPHLQRRKALGLAHPQRIVGDAGYGQEQTYAYLEREQIGNYLKYASWHKEQTHAQQDRFHKSRFAYDATTDSYECPNHRRLVFRESRERINDSGYRSLVRRYECENCRDCLLKVQCTRSAGNRAIEVSPKLEAYQKQARENLASETGRSLRRRRGPEIETVFGDLKHNRGYRRIRLRGLSKVIAEMALVLIGYNLRKLFHLEQLAATA